MKRIFAYMGIVILLASCESSDVTYPDYTIQTVYFPVQNPVRTLVLGESRVDNSIDLEHAFTIGASVGGVYKNTKNRILKIKYAPELVNNLMSGEESIEILPERYYTASSLNEIVIPSGSFSGRIRIDLKDEFFEDPKCVGLKYVIPLIILPTSQDSVLSGKPTVANPIRTNKSDWQSGLTPKDYTLYAIKYINRYHGVYFHRGSDEELNGDVVTKTERYRKQFIEEDLVTSTKTVSLSECTIDRLGGDNVRGKYQMKLKFNDDKTIAISQIDGGVPVTGTGTFLESKNGEVWGGVKHMTLYLKYNYTDESGKNHRACDTLVYRSNGVVYEEFTIKQN